MPSRTLHDTISDKTGRRLRVEGKQGGELSYQYSNGAEVITAPVAPGIPGKMGPVKEVVRTYAPRSWMTMRYKEGQYERIFGKERG